MVAAALMAMMQCWLQCHNNSDSTEPAESSNAARAAVGLHYTSFNLVTQCKRRNNATA
jgi:hypothetical protein